LATSPETISIDILLLFVLIITVTMTFEIHKDIADAEWDGKNKKNTMPVILGTRKTAKIVFSLYLIGIMVYHGILLSIGFQFDLIFWMVDLIIFLALLPLFKLINQHDNVDYVHKTRKITMGILSVVVITLIVNYMNVA
jgi:4-hydroxybenzoate polyprenyltransferase